MRIGRLHIDPPVVLAPMAGVTDAAFRALCRSYGPALFFTEMITARALVERNPRTMRMVRRAEGDAPHGIQLYGVAPDVVETAVRIAVSEVGADHVDLNFGCPAPKVTRKGGGAALPAHRVLFRDVVRAAVRAAGSVPVTVKMRIGLDSRVVTAPEAARIAAGEGVSAITLHARTAEQRYHGPADWEAIAELKSLVDKVPVLGNGDIWEASDAIAMRARTGCDGVVIGRGCLGRPWLFAELARAFSNPSRTPQNPPLLGEVADVMLRHATLLADDIGEHAGAREFRKHCGWYLAGYPVGAATRKALCGVSDLAGLSGLLDRLDPATALPTSALRLPRGHTDGPRPVDLPDGWLDARDDPLPPRGADVLVSGG